MPLDAIISLFIFLIGLPAILLQTLPSEIRKLVLSRRRQLLLYSFIPLILASVVTAIAILTPVYYSNVLNHDSQSNPLLSFLLLAYDGNLWWAMLLSLLLLIAGVAAMTYIERWRRDAVIKQLTEHAAKGISQKGRPIEAELKNLIQLGKQSQAGLDKELVLSALADLANLAQRRPGYDGAQLEELVIGLEEILVFEPYKGSSENFHSAGDIVSDIIISSCNKANADDLKLAIQTASMLGRASLEYELSHIQTKFIDALKLAGEEKKEVATWMSQALFEIGSVATECDQYLVAMAALSRLEALASKHSPVAGELAVDFISLIAHFWCESETAKSYVEPILKDASQLFSQPLPEVIRIAQDHCRQTANFKTSDHLIKMLNDLEQESLS